jgi:hypothetical protein
MSELPEARRITPTGKNHLFGYYEKTPWDASGRYVLALETELYDRIPTVGDPAAIGLVDRHADDAWTPIAETRAWNWQQGCMAQWLPGDGRRVIYNDFDGERLVSVILDVDTAEGKTLPRPVYAISPDGRAAVSLNFSRFLWTRPVCGYAGVPDAWEGQAHPSDDGICRVDLASGESALIVSLGQMAEFRPREGMPDANHWFNHLMFNTDGSRFMFFHRWAIPGERWTTRLYTANADGSDIHLVADDDMTSHCDWRDERHILAWARQHDIGTRFYLFTDRSDERSVVGEGVLPRDGHCTFSPDRRWVLADCYPNRSEPYRVVYLYDPAENRRVDIARVYSPPELKSEIRCDLHPRWNRDGTEVCLDSAHEGDRQMYVVDVSGIVGG